MVWVAERLGVRETGVVTRWTYTPFSLLGGGPSGIGISSSESTVSPSTPGGGPSGMTISSSESEVNQR